MKSGANSLAHLPISVLKAEDSFPFHPDLSQGDNASVWAFEQKYYHLLSPLK